MTNIRQNDEVAPSKILQSQNVKGCEGFCGTTAARSGIKKWFAHRKQWK
jgi:hypothetical protein